jgi:superfamily II DNA or RNA helicase
MARLMLLDLGSTASVGSVTLHGHQISAVARLRAALSEFRGALLCDEVGMGKTYVALAVAARSGHCAIVAPGGLVSMWRDAIAHTGITARIFTFESLSRTAAIGESRPRFDLVIVDEAHHARNPTTNRYLALASLVRGARVILLSATPVHNRRKDLVALLSLFLGARAASMTSAEMALCVVRRERSHLPPGISVPVTAAPTQHRVRDDRNVVEQLMNLPPPMPVRDGAPGGALIGRGLVHQWASSEAALRQSLIRRIARATALCSSLECGHYPTAAELATWVYCDGALQLGFAELLSAPAANHAELIPVVRAHLAALERIRDELTTPSALDDERARILAAIRAHHRGVKIVAFAQYAETVSMFFRQLSRGGRVGLLTSRGARVAGGILTRDEAIHRFAPLANHRTAPASAEAIELLLTTDLLSEGVNLQDAGVVVHLDVPWTPARMEQRVGRVARIGSAHARTEVHVLRPPPAAEEVLAAEAIVDRKWRLSHATVGASSQSPLTARSMSAESTPAKAERLRQVLTEWQHGEIESGDDCLVATVVAGRAGFLAVVCLDGTLRLLACEEDVLSAGLDAQISLCSGDPGVDASTDRENLDSAVNRITDWCASERARRSVGKATSEVVRRRRLTERIDAAIQTALPHQRSRRSKLAALARRVVTTQQCAAAEADLELLLQSPLPPDQWLGAVAAIDASPEPATDPDSRLIEPRIHALLLFSRSA